LVLVFDSSSFVCPNYGPGIENSRAYKAMVGPSSSSSIAITTLDGLGGLQTYPICYYSSNSFYRPLGYLALPLGAVAVRDRPAQALRVTSTDPRCRAVAGANASAPLLLCPPSAVDVAVRVVGRYVFAQGAGRGQDDLLAERVRFGEAYCSDVSTAESGLSQEEMEEWPDWRSTGVGALTCTLPKGYGQRKPVYVDLRQNQQGQEPAYLLSYEGCPLFSSPDDRLLGGREGGACLCDRQYFAAGRADWPLLQRLGLLQTAQLQRESLFDLSPA